MLVKVKTCVDRDKQECNRTEIRSQESKIRVELTQRVDKRLTNEG